MSQELRRTSDAATKGNLNQRIAGYSARLAPFDKLEHASTKQEFANILEELIKINKPWIKQLLAERFNVDVNQKGEDFDYYSFRDIPDDVQHFLKKTLPESTFMAFENLPTKKPGLMRELENYLDYHHFKWNFWYWSELYYGQKNQIFTWLYRLSIMITLGSFLLGLSLCSNFFWPYVVFGFCFAAGAAYINWYKLATAMGVFLVVAGLLTAMFFCPPLTLTLLFGLKLTGGWALFNILPMSVIAMFSMGLKKMIEPKEDTHQNNPFAPGNLKAAPNNTYQPTTLEQKALENIKNQVKFTELFKPSTDATSSGQASSSSKTPRASVAMHGKK